MHCDCVPCRMSSHCDVFHLYSTNLRCKVQVRRINLRPLEYFRTAYQSHVQVMREGLSCTLSEAWNLTWGNMVWYHMHSLIWDFSALLSLLLHVLHLFVVHICSFSPASTEKPISCKQDTPEMINIFIAFAFNFLYSASQIPESENAGRRVKNIFLKTYQQDSVFLFIFKYVPPS